MLEKVASKSKTLNEVKPNEKMNKIQMCLTVLINIEQIRFQKYHLLESKYDSTSTEYLHYKRTKLRK